MATYAMSDIHGCFDEFLELLELIDFTGDDKLYILGDVIDRGPKSGEMVSLLADAPSNILFQMGNHEEMMSWALQGAWGNLDPDPECFESWMKAGGDSTYEQLQHLPAKYIDKFQDAVRAAPYIRVGKVAGHEVVFAHAGIYVPGRKDAPITYDDISDQLAEDLIWGSDEWYSSPDELPCHVVFGHVGTRALSRQDFLEDDGDGPAPAFRCDDEGVLAEGRANRIMQYKRRHALDCSCATGGNLGVLRIDDWKAFHVPCHEPGGYYKFK